MYDRFDRQITYLRVSVTDRCNLRCTYCMPEQGVALCRHEDLLTFEEIRDLTATAVHLGVTKVRLTGGEPLVRRGIVTLVGLLAQVPGIADFAMTTNGTLLPELAVPLRKAGLQRLNVSLDALDAGRYRHLTRGGDVRQVLAGIEAAVAAGFTPVKLNCVVEASADEPDAQSVAGYGRSRGLEVRFIRRMDLRAGLFWPVQGGTGGDCGRCNRLRVSSDGRIYPCLFSDVRFSVRELGVEAALRMAVANKPAAGCRTEKSISAIGG